MFWPLSGLLQSINMYRKYVKTQTFCNRGTNYIKTVLVQNYRSLRISNFDVTFWHLGCKWPNKFRIELRPVGVLKYSLFNANPTPEKDIVSSLTLSFISLPVGCLFFRTGLCVSRRPILHSYVPLALVLEWRHYLLTHAKFHQKNIEHRKQ